MPVLSREALEASPLSDLHTIAGEIGLDGYRRLRKADLVDAILKGGTDAGAATEPDADADTPEAVSDTDTDTDSDEAPKRRSRSRGGRGRRPARDADTDSEAPAVAEVVSTDSATDEADEAPARAQRSRGRGRSTEKSTESDSADAPADSSRPRGRARTADSEPETVAEGTIEVLGNGSGFLRVAPPEPSDDDVYVSAAQIRRCELVSGDVVSGPTRPARRSERYPSLVRVDTINGSSADAVSESTPFDDLPSEFATERFELGTEDATLKAIEWLTPIGRGSRAVIVGSARSGKTEALRRLAGALSETDGVEVSVVLAGVRPEEVADWKTEGVTPVATLILGASADAQTSAVERAIDAARRTATRGANAVVLIDGLDGVHPPAARRALAAARNITGGGSLTVVATASAPLGGETTVVVLDVTLTSTDRLPALDLIASGTVRPELLVGEAGAKAIAQARADALGL